MKAIFIKAIILSVFVFPGIGTASVVVRADSFFFQPIAFQTQSESYASIVNKTPEKAWTHFIKVISDKPEIITLIDQTLEQIKPIIQFIAPEKMKKIMEVRSRLYLTPGNWKGHILKVGNITAKAGKVIVGSKILGTYLDKLTKASEKKDYISALGGMLSYSFLYRHDSDLVKIADAWKEVENPVKKYLKKSKVLID